MMFETALCRKLRIEAEERRANREGVDVWKLIKEARSDEN